MRIGRLIGAPRLSGKCGFVHVFENGSRQQLFADIQNESWELFKSLRQGDIISYAGNEFITRTGERTINVSSLNVLRRCEYGLPSRVAGVSLETSRRAKYMELLAEVASIDRQDDYRNTIILRSKVMRSIRSFMDSMRFIEVQTPILQSNAIGADATPFQTTDGQFLRIAPELELKKMIVGGFDRVYEIGKNFRNEGLSQKHNPEFTMLEFYHVGGDMRRAMSLTKVLLKKIVADNFEEWEVNNINWSDFQESGMDFVEEELIQPTFVTGFSAAESPLAESENGIAKRFELYAGGMELANGYVELNDPDIQLANFEAQGVVDETYIHALRMGLPPCFGVGIGIDRLLMLLTGRNIKEVL